MRSAFNALCKILISMTCDNFYLVDRRSEYFILRSSYIVKRPIKIDHICIDLINQQTDAQL